MSGGEDGHILALLEHDGLADLELLIDGRSLGLVVVAGVDDHHAGKGAHEGDILHGLVGCTVLTEGDTSVRGCDLDIGVSIGDLLADLVIDAAGDELGEGADERDLAGEGETGGGADHVGLGDAALHETLGELSSELLHLQGREQVGGHGDDGGVFLASLIEAIAETAAGVFLSSDDIFFHDSVGFKD